MQSMLALFPKRSVSQEQVHSHEAGSFLCAETETSESLTLPQGVRPQVGGEGTLLERKSVLPREAQEPQSLSSLPESSILLAE